MAWTIEALKPYDQRPAKHHAYLLRELEAVARGETDRLMIFMPPGHAKTRYASIVFPAWMLAQRIGIDMIGASYNAEYAEWISEQLIRLIGENTDLLGYSLLNENRKLWATSMRGQYRAAGAQGGITGRRADIVLIDDPIKGREDADSPTIREKVWSWYRAEVIPRLKPGGRVVLIQTRWHHDDLAGRLLDAAEVGGDQWKVINLPAIAEANDQLGREPGEALWPAWEDETALERKRMSVGPREWSALYQQNPTPFEGSMFKVGMLTVLDAAPLCQPVVRAWDLAATSLGDWTVGLKLGRTQLGQYVVLDIVRFRGGPDEVEATIINTAHLDGRSVRVRIPEDAGQAGKQQALYLGRKLTGFAVSVERETGSKEVRAAPVASQVNIGNVLMVAGAWNMPFREELSIFPAGGTDDQVDALSGAFSVIGIGQQPIRISPEAVANFTGARVSR